MTFKTERANWMIGEGNMPTPLHSMQHICICTYAAMGVERYLTIARQITLTKSHLAAIVTLNFLWALLSTTSVFWGDRSHHYFALQPSNAYCTLAWWTPFHFTHASCLGTVVLSLTVFAAGYYGLVAFLRNHAKEWKDTAGMWDSEGTFEDPDDPNQTIHWKKPRYCQLAMEKSLVLVLTFVASWSVYAYIMISNIATAKPTAPIVDHIGVVLVYNK
ncbi:hypothetical protein HDU86_006094 [Geranomyces michiganensis]|nr:hypothetical protein HDU86_006094 [Geranomyces michiganensis]